MTDKVEGETQGEALGSTIQTCEEAASADWWGRRGVRGCVSGQKGEEAAGTETSLKRFDNEERRAV